MAERDKLYKWTDDELLEWIPHVNDAPQSRAAVEFESQHRLAQRQLEAAEGLRKLTSGLRTATEPSRSIQLIWPALQFPPIHK